MNYIGPDIVFELNSITSFWDDVRYADSGNLYGRLLDKCRSRLTHRSSVHYDIQTDDQQYGFKIFYQASGGACHQ
ncbi:hypothetical protein Prudu_003349 [Prunus dulcis]|uniref:Uncharacterized protein n=1 Tax=Prunus dulcis TaxID=3755 RepID=A0A4Y1QSU5_PRUDU|nr:hypothetical protein Prudu_003349 [Prunus dulcis]